MSYAKQQRGLKLDLPHSQLHLINSRAILPDETVTLAKNPPLHQSHPVRRIRLDEAELEEAKASQAGSQAGHHSKAALRLVPEPFQLAPVPKNTLYLNPELPITSEQPVQTGISYLCKRWMDLVGSLILLLVLAIPMLMLAIVIKLDSPGPVIFRQIRVGKNGRVFTFFKFRSMYTDADARLEDLKHLNETQGATFKMKNDPRITRVGRFIRRSSLDELPQLFNVLAGQMSLVGPRPGLVREAAHYRPDQYRRLAVSPGLTGLWQVSGRSSLSFEEMVKLDLYYVEHWSLWFDLKILFRTIGAVIRAEGAY